MAQVFGKSTAVTNANSTPRVQNPAGIQNGVVKRSQGFANIANGDTGAATVAGGASLYRIGKVRSSDYMDRVRIVSADIGTGAVVDVGLYDVLTHTNGGAVVNQTFFASAVDLKSGAIDLDITFESAAAGGLYTNAEKRVWEALGLTSDPHKEYDIALTLTTTSDAAGTVLVRYYYV